MNRQINRVVVLGKTVAECDFVDDAEVLADHWSRKIDNASIVVERLGPNGWQPVELGRECAQLDEPAEAPF